LCIDACDAVMRKIGRPTRLIAYDTDLNIERRLAGKPTLFKIVRMRTVLYISVIHDRNPVYVRLADGGIRNGYTIRVLNKWRDTRFFTLTVEGAPDAGLEIVGDSTGMIGRPVIEVGPDQTREVRALVTLHRPSYQTSAPLSFRIVEPESGAHAVADDHFRAPH
jgi:polyferredoxin